MEQKKQFSDVILEDRTEEIGMTAFQGPETKRVLQKILKLPDPWRNRLRIGRTGWDLDHGLKDGLYG